MSELYWFEVGGDEFISSVFERFPFWIKYNVSLLMISTVFSDCFGFFPIILGFCETSVFFDNAKKSYLVLSPFLSSASADLTFLKVKGSFIMVPMFQYSANLKKISVRGQSQTMWTWKGRGVCIMSILLHKPY